MLGARDPDAAQAKLRLLLGQSELYEVVEADADGVREVILDGALKLA